MKAMPTEAALRRWGDDILASVAFLTRIPVARWLTVPHLPLGQTMRAFPIVGALLGIAGGFLLWLLHALGAPPLLAGAITLAGFVLLTGALHEDGLADMADGFGAGRDRDDTLTIMRDSRIGTFGVIALVLVLLFKAASLADIAERSWYVGPAVLASTGAFSRALIVWLMGAIPPARRDGLSASAGQPAEMTVQPALLIGGIGAAVLLLAAGGLVMAVLVLATGFATATAVRAIAMERIGGQTGDVCGAVQVLSETAMLAMAATVLP
jgi:adenosylcobinamide-GDP ribazoletransferase